MPPTLLTQISSPISGPIRSLFFRKSVTSSVPFTSREPNLVVNQPFAGPRHNRVGDQHILRPLACLMKAEHAFAIDMWKRFTGSGSELRQDLDPW